VVATPVREPFGLAERCEYAYPCWRLSVGHDQVFGATGFESPQEVERSAGLRVPQVSHLAKAFR
jgi:hypothetical protein